VHPDSVGEAAGSVLRADRVPLPNRIPIGDDFRERVTITDTDADHVRG
jgi:hypothetical protein